MKAYALTTIHTWMLYVSRDRGLQLLAQSCPVSGLCLTRAGGSLGALIPPTGKTLVPLLQLSQPVHATYLEFCLVFTWESCWNWYPGPNSSVPGWVPDILLNLGQSHGSTHGFFQMVNNLWQTRYISRNCTVSGNLMCQSQECLRIPKHKYSTPFRTPWLDTQHPLPDMPTVPYSAWYCLHIYSSSVKCLKN